MRRNCDLCGGDDCAVIRYDFCSHTPGAAEGHDFTDVTRCISSTLVLQSS